MTQFLNKTMVNGNDFNTKSFPEPSYNTTTEINYQKNYEAMCSKIRSDVDDEFSSCKFDGEVYYLTKYNYRYYNDSTIVSEFNHKLYYISNTSEGKNYVVDVNGQLRDRSDIKKTLDKIESTLRLYESLDSRICGTYIIDFNDECEDENQYILLNHHGAKLELVTNPDTMNDEFILQFSTNKASFISIPNDYIVEFIKENKYALNDIKYAYFDHQDFTITTIDQLKENLRFRDDLLLQKRLNTYKIPDFTTKEIFDKVKHGKYYLDSIYSGKYFIPINLF